MSLTDGTYAVAPGSLALVVTHLEMRSPAPLRPAPDGKDWQLRRVTNPDVAWYRTLFYDVGSDWFWFSRLAESDENLDKIIQSPDTGIWTLCKDGQDAALLELNFQDPRACELSFFGLAPALIGSGAGRRLMNAAIEIAWSRPIERFHLKTCTLDSAAALPFYLRSGFVPIKQEVEIAPDPRLTGLLPKSIGKHIPMTGPGDEGSP